MFQLIKDVRGIVVLHDFFISHVRELMYSTKYIPNSSGNFLLEAGNAHGLFCLIDFQQRGLNKAIWNWPVNWDVMKYAQEIIVHSNYQNILMAKFYNHGWFPRLSVTNQLHKTENIISHDEKSLSKQSINISNDNFTFCSFGFINPTKLNLLAIEAFSRYLSNDENATFIFVGEMDKGDYEQEFWELVNRLGISEHIRVTGFVDMKTYRNYFKVADIAIQLRANSRGETSRAVLDCMAFGIPTIINAYGSLNDYINEDVYKLPEIPTANDLYQSMVQLRQDDDLRIKIGQNAWNAIKKYHHPELVASAYYNIIRKTSKTNDRFLFAPLIDTIVTLKVSRRMESFHLYRNSLP
jgi:glycosyltransferase involved in cell wall biosynthesis